MKELKGNILASCIAFSEYLLCLLIMLECNSVFRSMADRPGVAYHSQLVIIFFTVVLIVLHCLNEKKNIDVIFESSILILFLLIFGIMFFYFNVMMTYNIQHYTLAFLYFLPLMTCLFKIYGKTDNVNKLFYRMSDIILVLAVISLFIWFFSSIVDVIKPTGKVNVDWGGINLVDNYYNMRFVLPWQKEKFGFLDQEIFRNTGIFPESPMYNIFLVSAFYTELFLKEKKQIWKLVIIALTICSTIGTAGIFLLVIGLFLKYYNRLLDKKKSLYFISAIISVTFLVVAALIFNKVKNGYGSLSTRIDDYMAGFKAWRAYPLIGSGYDNESVIQYFMSDFRKDNLGFSNSIFAVLAEGGIVLFAFYAISFAALLRQYFTKNHREIAYWGIGIIGLFISTIFHFRFYMIMLLAYGYSWLSISYLHQGNDLKSKLKIESTKVYEKENIQSNGSQKYYIFLLFFYLILFTLNIFQLMLSGYREKGLLPSLFAVLGILTVLVGVSSLLKLKYVISTMYEEKRIKLRKKSLPVMVNVICIVIAIISAIANNLIGYIRAIMELFELYLQQSQWRFLICIIILLAIMESFLCISQILKYRAALSIYLGILLVVGLMFANFTYKKLDIEMPRIEKNYQLIQVLEERGISKNNIYVDNTQYLYQQIYKDMDVKLGMPKSLNDSETVLALSDDRDVCYSLSGDKLRFGKIKAASYLCAKGEQLIQILEEEGVSFKN